MAAVPTEIIGHARQCAQLREDIAHGNVAHAYLFAGPPRLGKLTVARWFSWQLLSQDMESDAARSALRTEIARMTHPDVLVLDRLWIEGKQESWEHIAETSNVPQQHRAKKKMRSDAISIDDIRALQERLYETGSSRYVCCVIRSVERLQDAAANAFLKILEEPPSRVVFILTTQMSNSLLPTLVSRTRVLSFGPLTRAELSPLFAGVSEDESAFIRHLAQGAPGHALRLLRTPDLLREEKLLHGQAKRFWQASSLHERLQWLQSFQEPGKEWDGFLLHLGLTLRESSAATLRTQRHRAYMDLLRGRRTNAHKGLLLTRFALAA